MRLTEGQNGHKSYLNEEWTIQDFEKDALFNLQGAIFSLKGRTYFERSKYKVT